MTDVQTNIPPATAIRSQTADAADASADAGASSTPGPDLVDLLAQISRLLGEAKPAAKALVKDLHREKNKKKKRTASPSAAGIMQRDLVISDELNAILGNPPGHRMTRPDVTQAISNYTKTNNLKDPDNMRVVIVDEKLASIARTPEGQPPVNAGDRLNLFKLIGFLKHHISKADEAEGSA